jgi:AmmeMemoRadiSam system protein A
VNDFIPGAVIVPHPPLIIPDVGRGEEKKISKTIDAYDAAAQFVRSLSPEAIVITTPHIIAYYDYFHIAPGSGGRGDMHQFRAPQASLSVSYDNLLREAIIDEAEKAGLAAGTLGERDPSIDHASFIPLWFLQKAGVSCPVVRIGLSGFSAREHYQLGMCIQKAARRTGKRVVLVASGDLSHKLKEDGPYGFAPEGPLFDRQVTRAMDEGDFLQFLTFDEGFSERSANCGLKSFQIMAGALDGLAVQSKLLSYEGPFGVGYGVAAFRVTGEDPARHFLPQLDDFRAKKLAEIHAGEDPYVRLARLSVDTYVRTGRKLTQYPDDLPPQMKDRRAGVFVSLHEFGQLRGCIGTIGPVTGSIAEEIVQNGISACSRDPRFAPVRADELGILVITVDVLGQTEPVDDPSQLDPKRYGVIVSCGRRRGLLLPNLDGVDTVAEQIRIAREKGGIGEDEPYQLERFEVVRHY